MLLFRSLSMVSVLATMSRVVAYDVRSAIDVCASVDADLTVPGYHGGNPTLVGKLGKFSRLSLMRN